MPAMKPVEGTEPNMMHVSSVATTTGQGLEIA